MKGLEKEKIVKQKIASIAQKMLINNGAKKKGWINLEHIVNSIPVHVLGRMSPANAVDYAAAKAFEQYGNNAEYGFVPIGEKAKHYTPETKMYWYTKAAEHYLKAGETCEAGNCINKAMESSGYETKEFKSIAYYKHAGYDEYATWEKDKFFSKMPLGCWAVFCLPEVDKPGAWT